MKNVVLFLIITFSFFSCQNQEGDYVCPPCDLPCDKLFFPEPGICPHCNMELIHKNDLIIKEDLIPNEINLEQGSSAFLINRNKPIFIHYYLPENHQPDSPILLVIPGAGRDGDEYRDAWIPESEKYSALILSLEYEEEHYPFEDYHMCGLIKNINLQDAVKRVEGTNMIELSEDKFNFEINMNKADWLFNDFDYIFDQVVEATKGRQEKYDIFGHSAGGQILHRSVIFNPTSKADKIVAANSGFYTLPNTSMALPFGINGTGIENENFKKMFSNKLIILNGELDNANETGGTLLRSPTVDKQGLHRLERGQYFYDFSKNIANEIATEINWSRIVVPNIGHDHEGMGDAAAKILYEKK